MDAAPLTLADIRRAVREELAAAPAAPLLVDKAGACRVIGIGRTKFDELVRLGPALGGLPPGRTVPGFAWPMWRVTDLEKWAAGLRRVRPATTD